jgi:hypothetical protein
VSSECLSAVCFSTYCWYLSLVHTSCLLGFANVQNVTRSRKTCNCLIKDKYIGHIFIKLVSVLNPVVLIFYRIIVHRYLRRTVRVSGAGGSPRPPAAAG